MAAIFFVYLTRTHAHIANVSGCGTVKYRGPGQNNRSNLAHVGTCYSPEVALRAARERAEALGRKVCKTCERGAVRRSA